MLTKSQPKLIKPIQLNNPKAQKIESQPTSRFAPLTDAMKKSGIVKLLYQARWVPSQYRGKLYLALVDTRLLFGAPGYQRPGIKNLIEQKIGNGNFHFASVGIITVSWDGNKANVVDGNNRREALRLMGNHLIEAFVWIGLTPQEEALMFANFNGNKVKCSKWVEFNAKLLAGLETEAVLSDLCKQYDLTTPITSDSDHADVRNTSILYEIYTGKGSLAHAHEFLKVLSVWGREASGFLSKAARNLTVQRGLNQWMMNHPEWTAKKILKRLDSLELSPCDIQSLALEVMYREKIDRANAKQFATALTAAIIDGRKPKRMFSEVEDVVILKKVVKKTTRVRRAS